MAIADPCILYGIRFGATSYVLRVTFAATTENLTFPATGSLDPIADYFMSGDGTSTDLIGLLQATLLSHTQVSTLLTATLDADFHVVIDPNDPVGSTILWTHASTTLSALTFGFTGASDTSIASNDFATAPNAAMGIWRPKRPCSDDTRNQRITVGGISTTLSGLTRVSSMVAPASLPRERVLSWRNLIQTEVLDEYGEATDPYGAFEYAWFYSLSRGYHFRYYADESSTTDRIYTEHTISALTRPYQRSGDFRIRWDVTIPANYVTESTYTNAYSLRLDGTNDYIDCGDTTTTDSLTACSWNVWFIVPNSWPAGEKVMISKWATSNLNWKIAVTNAVAGGLIVYIPQDLVTGTAKWTSAASVCAPDTWYMFTVVFNGALSGNSNRLKLFLNGSEITSGGSYVSTIPAAMTGNGTATMRLGTATSDYFPGNLDETAIWAGHALTTSEIAILRGIGHPSSLYVSGLTKPTHWWRFENNALDSGYPLATRAHGTPSGGPTYSTLLLP